MNDNEKYLFDLRGYIVVKHVLSASQLEAQRKTNPRPVLGSDRTIFRDQDDPAWSAPSLRFICTFDKQET